MRAHSDDVKAQVMAALLEGQSVHAVAKDFNVPRSTVIRWKGQISDINGQGSNHWTPKREIGELILELLHERLETLRVQTEFFRDLSWLKKQGAAELAVLHGVEDDKLMRQIELMSKGDATDDHITQD